MCFSVESVRQLKQRWSGKIFIERYSRALQVRIDVGIFFSLLFLFFSLLFLFIYLFIFLFCCDIVLEDQVIKGNQLKSYLILPCLKKISTSHEDKKNTDIPKSICFFK